MRKQTIKLFKAVPIVKKEQKKPSIDIVVKTIQRGFLFSPEVVANYSENELNKLILEVEKEIGLTPKQLNASFHKSWGKIKEASIEQLVIEQLIHYVTTYGFEELGIFNDDSVYIPTERLEIPNIKLDKIKLVVIKGYTESELKDKLLKLLSFGIALKEDTIEAIVEIATNVEITTEEIEKIKNKEVKIMLYDYLEKIPKNPTEFMRYLIYKATNKTLIIKDKETIEALKEKSRNNDTDIVILFDKYKNKYSLEKLAEVFYRYKPLFLALKQNSKMNKYINKIRKLANKHHKPMKEDYLNSITRKIKDGSLWDEEIAKFVGETEKVNIFRRIRLAYALKFRTSDAESILYRIRNGKAYTTNFNFKNKELAQKVLSVLLQSIINDIKLNVEGKKIYIPENIKYALPTTEKQFTGNIPSGSYVSIPKDMVFGIHWENVDNHRIDLDLSLTNITQGKIGWDSRYRTSERDILFSGDITNASKPNGASELFYIQKQNDTSYLVNLNYYNFNKRVPVPFKIIVAEEAVKNFNGNYMVNPNNVVAINKTIIDKLQKILGLVTAEPEECRFYFTETNLGKSITSSVSNVTENARKYIMNYYKNTITLNEVLKDAGAEIVDSEEDCDINLTPETLEKDTILNLLIKNDKEK